MTQLPFTQLPFTQLPFNPDLAVVARDAGSEIEAAETAYPDGLVDPSATELGYYEAELRSLRDAATSLGEAEASSL